MRFLLMVLLVSLLVVPSACARSDSVIVRLFASRPQLKTLVVRSPLQVLEGAQLPSGVDELRLELSSHRIVVRTRANLPLRATGKLTFEGRNGKVRLEVPGGLQRSYRGRITVAVEKGSIAIYNRVAMRDYIQSVVGSETNPDTASAALEAQSIMAQTWMARYKPGDRLLDNTERQAYFGCDHVRAAVAAAVDRTWGRTLVWGSNLTTPYFHAACSGGTSNGEQYFELKRGSCPYLQGVVCNYCKASPFWEKKAASIPLRVWKDTFATTLVSIVRRDNRLRPLLVKMGSQHKSGYACWMQIGQRLGWDKVPGTRFDIQVKKQQVVITSTGAGHGVGLCQWGADGLAKQGASCEKILGYYFPGAIATTPAKQ